MKIRSLLFACVLHKLERSITPLQVDDKFKPCITFKIIEFQSFRNLENPMDYIDITDDKIDMITGIPFFELGLCKIEAAFLS